MKVFDTFDEWYTSCYHDSGEVIPAARSFSMLHDKAPDHAVLMIHGYAGYPGEMVSPAERLYEAGCDVFVPRLPGMGTSGKDFMNTTRYDWMYPVTKALDFLYENYTLVDILAHSMGCLLAVLAARRRPHSRLVLAMPAFRIPALDMKKLRLVSVFRKDLPASWHSDSRYRLHYENAPCDDMILGKEYYSHIYPRQLYQMGLLCEEAGRAMKEIRNRILILASESDTVTDASAVRAYEKKASVRFIENATHFVFYDISESCEEEALRESEAFLS